MKTIFVALLSAATVYSVVVMSNMIHRLADVLESEIGTRYAQQCVGTDKVCHSAAATAAHLRVQEIKDGE